MSTLLTDVQALHAFDRRISTYDVARAQWEADVAAVARLYVEAVRAAESSTALYDTLNPWCPTSKESLFVAHGDAWLAEGMKRALVALGATEEQLRKLEEEAAR